VSLILDKDLIKSQLDNDKVIELIQELGSANPFFSYDSIVCETICHNHVGEGSYKLYYYPNTKLFKCYTSCGNAFDIFDLVIRQFKLKNIDLSMPQAVRWVADRMSGNFSFDKQQELSGDWDILNKYKEISEQAINEKQELIEYPRDILKRLPFYIIDNWRQEGITPETMRRFGIKYNSVTNAVIIPHYDEDRKLVGIRQRAMVKEDEDLFGKYRPATINGKMYNHPLSYCFYGLSLNQENIGKTKKAIVFEGEKSVMLFDSLFGSDNNISLSCCGSNISNFQVESLIKLGVQEMIVAFDKEYHKVGDEGFNNQVRNLKNIYKKYSNKLLVSFVFDKENKIGYKDSPIDKGRDTFIQLYEKRFTLEEA
jgi:hypothetical protein